jgi:hypothetical protein
MSKTTRTYANILENTLLILLNPQARILIMTVENHDNNYIFIDKQKIVLSDQKYHILLHAGYISLPEKIAPDIHECYFTDAGKAKAKAIQAYRAEIDARFTQLIMFEEEEKIKATQASMFDLVE